MNHTNRSFSLESTMTLMIGLFPQQVLTYVYQA